MPSHQCSYCPEQFSAPSEELLLTHIRLVHSSDPGFSIQCAHQGCMRTFTNFKAFQNHRRLKHAAQLPSQDLPSSSDDHTAYSDVENPEAVPHTVVPSHADIQSFSSKWILKIGETRKLTRAATLGIVEDVSELVAFVSKTLMSQTQQVLKECGVTSEVQERVDDLLQSPVTRPFEGLESFHKQLQYYRKHFNLIVGYIVYPCTSFAL